MSARNLFKRVVEKFLTSPPLLNALKRRSDGRSVVLAYHNVIPDNEGLSGASGAHLPLSEFQWQLDVLEEYASIIPLDSLVREPHPGGRLQAALTFDDAYVGTFRCALPELVRRELPATVFVPTGLVGTDSFWWDDLGISGWEGDRIPLESLRGETPKIREWASVRGIDPTPQNPNQVPATEEQILTGAESEHLSFGVHTVGHPNLARLDSAEVRKELGDARKWLSERRLPLSHCVAYPYGLTSGGVERVVEELGFEAGFTISGGSIPTSGAKPYRLPRLIIPAGLTRENFVLRIHGLISS